MQTMIQIEKFFCFQLMTAGMIIGWYGLAESLASSITGIVMLENVDTYFSPANFPDFDAKTARARKSIAGEYVSLNIETNMAWERIFILHLIPLVFINIVGTAVAMGVLNILACGLLVIAVVKVINWIMRLNWSQNGLS